MLCCCLFATTAMDAAAAIGLGSTVPLDVEAAGGRQVRDVGVDAQGRRYVLLGPNGTVAVFTAAGRRLAEWSAGEIDPATAGFGHMAVAPDGTVYLSARNALRAFDSSGRLLRDFGPPPHSFGWNGPLAVEASGSLLTSAGGVQRFTPDGRLVSRLRGFSGMVMASSPDGGFWLSSGDGIVEGFGASGRLRARFGGGEPSLLGDGSFGTMSGLAVDGARRLWVASGSNHQVFSRDGRLLSVCDRPAPGRLAILGIEAVEGEFSLAAASRVRAASAGCRRPRQPVDRVSIVRRGDHLRIRFRGLQRAAVMVRFTQLVLGRCDPDASYSASTCEAETFGASRRIGWRRGNRTASVSLRGLERGRYLVQLQAVDARDNRFDSPLIRITKR